MIRKICALSVVALLLSTVLVAQEEKNVGQVSGMILDHSTQEPLALANILILNSPFGVTSSVDGKFMLDKIPVGIYTVRVSLLGYKPQIRSDVVVKRGKTTFLTIELDENLVQSEEITVTDTYFSRHAEDVVSIHGLTTEEIRRAPGAAEDINRVIQTLPGITFANDQRNDIIVRGGSPLENLFLVDNIDIPNINHYATFGATGGAISMVDVKYIDKVNVYTGGFAPKYGDRLSAVMSISLRPGNRDHFQGTVDAGIAGFGVAGEGPIGNRGSWILSARKSYLELIKEAVQLKSVPHYQDAFAKMDYEFSPATKLTLLGMGGIDEISTSANEEEPLGFQGLTQENYQYSTGMVLRQLFGKFGFGGLTVSRSVNRYDTKLLNLTDFTTQYDYTNTSRETEMTVKFDGIANASTAQQVGFGTGIRFIDFDHTIFAKPDTLRSIDTTVVYVFRLDYQMGDKARKFFSYVNYSLSLPRWTFNVGIRYDYFSDIVHAHMISPRFNAVWRWDDVTSVNLAAGIFRQSPSLSWVSSREVNRSIFPMRCWHFVLGIERLLDIDTRVSIEGYVKYYDRYPVSVQNPTMVMIDAAAGFSENVTDSLRNGGMARSIGLDFFVQKKLSSHLYGLVSYALSETRAKSLVGGWRPGAFDNRHVVTISGGYVFDEYWQASVKLRYATGRAFTPMNVQLSVQFNQPVLDFSRLYAERHPDYFRWDVRIDRRDNFRVFSIVSYVELQNVTNRKNVFTQVWDQRKRATRTLYQFSFLPIAGIRIEF